MTASLSSFYTSQWDDDQLFEMKHKRNRSKSFNNGALKMGLPDSASDEKANWNEFLIVAQRNHHTVTQGRVTNVHMDSRVPSAKVYFLEKNEVTHICYLLSFWLISSWNISCWAFLTWHILLRSYLRGYSEFQSTAPFKEPFFTATLWGWCENVEKSWNVQPLLISSCCHLPTAITGPTIFRP